MTAMPQPNLVTVADYLSGESTADVKHEYLGGTIHAMAGASNQHNTIALNAQFLLLSQLRNKPCQPFNSDTKVRIELSDHTRFYYPDAMVVCHPNPPTDHFQDLPVVVIEVLSESTRRIDMGEKRDAYLSIPSLKLLLLIEPDVPLVIIRRRRTEGGFSEECYSGLDAVIPLPEIDASLPLSGLYERTSVSGPGA